MSADDNSIGAAFAERQRLEALRAKFGPMKSEAKEFTPSENIRVKQTSSSTAGANSGEFHYFRMTASLEEKRLKKMDKEWEENVRKLEFQERRVAAEEEEEQKRQKNVAARKRRKAAQEEAKKKKKLEAIAPSFSNDGSFLELAAKLLEEQEKKEKGEDASNEDKGDEKDQDDGDDGNPEAGRGGKRPKTEASDADADADAR